MTLKYAAARAVLEEIRKSTTNDLLFCEKSNAPVLKSLYDSEAINEKDLMQALEQAVFNEARQAIKTMRGPNPYYRIDADHACVHTEHLVYAINHNILNSEELEVVRTHLGHEGTLENFVKEHAQSNVLESLKERLLNPKPLEFSGSRSDADLDFEHPCCCSH